MGKLLFSVLIAAAATANAEPIVAPIADGGVRTFHEEPSKYQLFNAPTGATHAGGVMTWWYNDANRPGAVSKSAALTQIRASMAKWSAACKITFSYQGETTTGFSLLTSSIDGKNVIGWDGTGITAPTTGITQIAWNGSNTIVDAEIRLNAAYSATYDPSTNLDATLTHEIGHSIGLEHSDVQNQVMSGPPLTSYTGRTSLGSDDIAGCVKLYGAPGTPPPDTLAPSVPAGLTATAISTTTINLAWSASTDNVGVVNYNVYSGGTLLGTSTGTTASVSGLTPGTAYTFRVAACDAASNCSAQSAAASATTLSTDTQPPTVPTGLAATAAGASQVNLSWNASTDNVGVANYVVYIGGTQLGTTTSTNASVTGLAAATTYTFTVSACDAAGNCSAQSSPASATTAAVTPPPPTCSGPQPPDDQQVVACPAGQTGSIVQSRSYTCVGTTWTPGVFQTISNTCTASTAPQSYQDMWWAGSSENGWGLTITQHGEKLFLPWYLYDTAGNPLWIVMSSGQWNAAHTTYTGDLYIPGGSSFASYDVSRFVAGSPVGSASVTFSSSSTGTLAYTVRGVSGAKSISRLAFGPVDATPIASYGDMWWGGASQDGWGLVLTQQYRTLFATWFTYDAAGQVTWFVMSSGTWSGNTYSGTLYRTHGTPVLGAVYDASALVVTPVGTLSIAFGDPDNATMTYTVDGVTQTKAITRLLF